MPSESVSSFLDQARASRVVPPDELDDLFRDPDVPKENLAAVCDYLLSRGVLTRFQADQIRAGKATELSFAGYPIVDELGPCPGGTAYRVLHPSLRTPLVLRRLRPEWVGEADNVAAYVQRARDASPIVHANLAQLLDAGVYLDEPFVTLDPCDGADLQALVTDIGPMPTALAVRYAKQLADALHAAHSRGVVHGEVRPGWVFVAPLVPMVKTRPDGTPRLRPAADAAAKLSELGLIPRHPPLSRWAAPDDVRAYLAPERFDSAEPTTAGDLYGLGATVYFLMTGQHPNPNGVTPLDALRTDAPTGLVRVVHALLSTDPAARPDADAAARQFAAVLDPPAAEPEPDVPLVAEDDVPLAAADPPAWVATPVDDATVTDSPDFSPPEYAEPAGWPPRDEPEGWAPPPDDPREVQERKAARAAKQTDSTSNKWLWIGVGAGLQVVAILGWIVYMSNSSGCSSPDPPAKKPPAKQQKK
jgi:hypothetical protein